MKLALLLLLAVPASAQIGAINTFPGGTSGQIQYNNGGRFGGAPGLSTATVAAMGVSTGSLRADFSAFISTAGPLVSTLGQSTATLSASTASVYAALQSTGSALTVETARATAAEALKVAKAGDTMTGKLTAPDATITYGLTAATGSFSSEILIGGAASVATYGLHLSNKNIIISGTGNEMRFSGPQNALIGHTGAFATTLQTNGVVRQTITADGAASFSGSVTVGSGTFGTGGLVSRGPVLAPAGSDSAPSFAWEDSPNSGFYRVGAARVGLSLNGSKLVQWNYDNAPVTMDLTGTMRVSDAASFLGSVTASSVTANDIKANYGVTMNTATIMEHMGIGVAADPAYVLQISGLTPVVKIVSEPNSAASLWLDSTNTATLRLDSANNTLGATVNHQVAGSNLWITGTGAFSGSGNDDYHIIKGDGVTKVVVQAATGNVGIGTASPGAKLHIWGGVLRSSATDESSYQYFTPDFGPIYYPTHLSKVNQGSPASTWTALDSGGGAESFAIKVVPSGTNGNTWMTVNGTVAQIIDHSGKGVSFGSYAGVGTAAPANTLIVDNIGIGTASPCSTCTLHVAGGASVTGAFAVASATFTVATTGQVGISTPTAGMNGNLRVRAGNGNAGGTVPVELFSWVGSSTTEGTSGEMVAAEYTVPANTLINNGDWLEVFCVAKATTTSYSKELVVSVDGDKDSTGTSTSVARQWTNKSKVWRSSSTNLMHHAERERGDPGGSAGQSIDIDYANAVATNVDFKVQCLIKGDATAPLSTAVGDEVMDLKHMSVILHPAP